MATVMTADAGVTRDQWLERRKQGIGASESPAVLGVSPWKRPYEVWAEKVGLIEPEDLSGNEAVEFGIRLERPIAEAFAERAGRQVDMWPQYHVCQHPDLSWLLCTPDATQECQDRGSGLVQIKTTSAYKASDWADGPPLYYQVQLQHELAVTGFAWGTLVVLIGGQKLRYFDCERNTEFISALLPRLADFWELVQDKRPPDVDGSLATAKALAKLHPSDNGETVVLPAEADDWSMAIENASEVIKRMEERKTEMQNRIKAALGDATFGMLPDGSRWKWATQERKAYTVEAASFRVLRKVK